MQGLEPIHVAPHLLQQQQRQQQQQQQRQQQQQQQTPHTQDTKELSSQDPGTGAGKGAVAELEGRQGALVGAVPQQQAPGKAAKVKAKAKAKLPGPAAVATALPQK
jgi:transcription initiation factor TFIID subunit TAF12